ncbi:DUF3037 domain-containing protein [Tengunoibacter tsumagoiensis]|uniref:DUF3037 domain-containing protein n=1 Tax=Tengunoibacter tsumagoiensis TaxID=2014871 RepID=A0A401ZW96_9CHLR|nr:DUF3037 domain-containing protein [Tengunoibacter tsumagoiensis]GCE11127.1 hypothetical protein KTT_09860 [Tengunoibacter tsumagoiensis]
MPATSYDYAIVRVVPRVERGECINIGVLLFCRTRRFLGMRVHLDMKRLQALAPDLELTLFQQQVAHLECVCQGNADSGPIGQLSQSERFHWLVSPRSTIVQCSPVHSGLCTDPEAALDNLLKKLVLPLQGAYDL